MRRTHIIGIAGGSGSGKTTLAAGLCDLMAESGSRVISQDHYYRGLPAGVSAESYNFDEPAALDLDALARDLAELKAGRAVSIPEYDFATHRARPSACRIEPTPLVIVEGLFIFVPDALRAVFDLRFFVDVPSEERLRRRLKRDMRERGRSEDGIREQWVRQVEPMYRRHVHPTRPFAEVVLNLPRGDDLVYCESVTAMWACVEAQVQGG